jgi:hypothetical protein
MANTKSESASINDFQILIHDINQVEMCISNYGKFGQQQSASSVFGGQEAAGRTTYLVLVCGLALSIRQQLIP